MTQSEQIEPFWQDFLRQTGRDEHTAHSDVYAFGHYEELAEELLELVLCGQKRATCSSLLDYQIKGDPVPKRGDLCVITHWDGTPAAVVETTEIAILPFKEVTWDMCKREGEDENLQSWQEGHVRFFTAEGASTGYAFSWDMPVIFEDFKRVWPPEDS